MLHSQPIGVEVDGCLDDLEREHDVVDGFHCEACHDRFNILRRINFLNMDAIWEVNHNQSISSPASGSEIAEELWWGAHFRGRTS